MQESNTYEPKAQEPNKQDRRLFFLLNMARHYLFTYAKQTCEKQFDISITQAGALLFIAKHEGCYQKELADALGLKKSAVTGLVTRMENNALISRQVSETDGRATTLHLSSKGKEKVPQILPMIKRVNSELLEDFSEQEIDVILRFLNKIINRFEA